MKAILVRQLGGPQVLSYEDVPVPVPGPRQVIVQLHAAGLNHRDLALRQRESSRSMLPFIPGSDGAGIVVAAGPQVSRRILGLPVVIYPALNWGPSQRHAGPDFRILGGPDAGTYAQFIAVPAENIFPKPEALSFAEAAACPVAALTAWRALVIRAGIGPGDRVLLPGIGSGVAVFALQIAKLFSATVYVTSHSDEKLEKAGRMGADAGVNYRHDDWMAAIRDWTHGEGVDIILDSVGAPISGDCLELLAPGGRLVSIGSTGGAETCLNLRGLYYRHLSLLGSTLGSPTDFEQALRQLAQEKIRPVIDRVFPLCQAAEAQQRLEAAEHFGKIVLTTANGTG